MANINKDHGYHLAALRQACDEEDIEWMEQQYDLSQDKPQADRHHTPVKSPNPKKMKANESQTQNEVSNTVLLNTIQKLIQTEMVFAANWRSREGIPANAEQLYNTVDTVHQLGQKGRVGDKPRLIVIQFAMRTVRDLVWKMSKEAKFCKEMKIRFREDFCKEDSEAHKRLWPRVEEARSRGLKAFLKKGYAVIDGRQIKE
ncbi:unnamed protein product [Oreochromis niloticus]|nr:unnamed protein product [Mustela putorius furo]